jgi:hypothetical protein
MDSRIREIEQWVAKAKADLGECGQEAYIRKLYLLDAEIRAIIRENGILPGATSPEPQQQRHVRRFTVPALAVSGVLGVLLLAATTVYLTQPLLMGRAPQPPAAHTVVAGFVPSAIEGELILADNGAPLNLSPADAPANAAPELPAGTVLAGTLASADALGQPATPAASQPASSVILANAPTTALPTAAGAGSLRPGTQPAAKPAPASPAYGGADDTVDVLLVASAGLLPPAPVMPQTLMNNGGSGPSVGFDGLTPQVARLEFGDRFTVPERQGVEIVNNVKTQLDPRGGQAGGGEKAHDPHRKHVDKSTEIVVDNVDNSAGDGRATKAKKPAKQERGAK